MKIRIKDVSNDKKEKYVYEVDNEKGEKTNIDVEYLSLAIKILDIASNKMTIRNGKAFEKFVLNLKRATKYSEKAEDKLIETPNILHREKDASEFAEYRGKYVKYDKRAQALFSLHNGWYENFISIVEEIKEVVGQSYNSIKDSSKDDTNLLYVASRIDGILDKYRKKPKTKTL